MEEALAPREDEALAVTVPTVETERLRLRGHRPEDLADCAAMLASPEVTRFIGGKPFSEEDVWTKLLRHIGHWSVMGFGFWVIEEKATGSFVGETGFVDFKRDIKPALDGLPEIGWALVPSAQGKGFATEAARAAIAWQETHHAWPRTVCMIEPGNSASIHVAEKCGYREFARTTYKDRPTILLERALGAPTSVKEFPSSATRL